MNPIRVMIVEDSRTIRLFLEDQIGADSRFEIAASVESGEEALTLVQTLRPDVISLDIRLPGIDGFEVTRRIMQVQPTPIVVCSASIASSDLNVSMNALAAGALTVIEKPCREISEKYIELGHKLRHQLALMSSVKVVRQRFTSRNPRRRPEQIRTAIPTYDCKQHGENRCIGIVSSTGGPAALAAIMAEIPPDFPASIFLVQHMTEQFHGGFVNWLNSISMIHVKIAEYGEIPKPGIMYVAPADRHMCVQDNTLIYDYRPPIAYQRPSGTLLLGSMARDMPEKSIGVILTGMGTDGCEGLAALHRAGAYTIAEHASTAVVNGMPKTAIDLGATREVIPLPLIASRLNCLVESRVGVINR